VLSAGIDATPGTPIQDEARRALQALDIPVNGHRSRRLTPELIAQADTVFCMTRAQCDAVVAAVPAAAGKTVCLDPDGDVPDPHGQSHLAYVHVAERLGHVIDQRLALLTAGKTAGRGAGKADSRADSKAAARR
jgi:protein-tyrosine-phosphatase